MNFVSHLYLPARQLCLAGHADARLWGAKMAIWTVHLDTAGRILLDRSALAAKGTDSRS